MPPPHPLLFVLDVFEELAYADGSVGWSLMANASATSYVAFLDEAAARDCARALPCARTSVRTVQYMYSTYPTVLDLDLVAFIQ